MFKKKTSLGLILLMVLLLAIPGLPGCSSKTVDAASYNVSLDVNPSIELTVTDNLITAVKALNDDGAEILFNTVVVGTTATDAISKIVLEMVNEGYIAKTEIDPYLLITVSNNTALDQAVTEDISASLQTAAEETLSQFELSCQVTSTLATDGASEESAALGISVGRYVLFRCIAKEESMTIEEVMAAYGHLTIGELMEIFEAAEDEISNDGAETTPTGSPDIAGDDSSSVSSGSSVSENPEISAAEQKAAIKLALSQYKAAKKAAIAVFHSSYQAIKAAYKDGLKALQKKGGKNAETDIKAQRKALKDKMLADRKAAIAVKKEAFTAARTAFLKSVSDLGLSEETLDELMEEESAEIEDPEKEEDQELEEEIKAAESEITVDKDTVEEADQDSDEKEDEMEENDAVEDGIRTGSSIETKISTNVSTGKGNKK